ncbi:MAG: hypothetical protein PHR35_12655 [Kiritimatiellae bacterium]|nr:hypothetical protein [Kiritimatiellia bacterium]
MQTLFYGTAYLPTACRLRRSRRAPRLLVAALLAAGCVGGHLGDALAPDAAAYRWLLRQQSAAGLVGNQEDDRLSGVYANALAAICYLRQGDRARAERIFDVFNAHAESEFKSTGGFHQMWDARTGRPHPDSDRWVGDNAWLLIALNRYRAATGDDRYVALANRIAGWILGLQDKDGGIYSGFSRGAPMDSKSTEANLDCYAALVAHPEARARVRRWLETAAWVPAEKRFRMGSTVDASALDGTSWGIGALGPEYAPALAAAESAFRRTVTTAAGGRTVTGFADLPGRDRVWFEGTGQMAVAYRVAGRDAEADFLIGEMRRAFVTSRHDPKAAGLPCFSGNPDWKGGADRIFAPSQAWYLLAVWHVNPLAAPEQRE